MDSTTTLTAILSFLGVLITIAAFYALFAKKLASAVIGAGLVSLIASVMYLVLSAPDVAMTEAAIGSGLSTAIFFYALARVRKANKENA